MMKRLLTFALLLFIAGTAHGQEITLQSLLRDMVSRDGITYFPDAVPYRTLQASSYNRASVSPDQPGWFADSDGVFCIRTEKNKDGETEWVLMEDEGPGAITKIWAVCFYYGLNDTIGANVRIYLDGEDEPTISGNFFDFVKGKSLVGSPIAAKTTRAGNSYLPIPYAKGCKVTMDRKVFYNIINYHHYPSGTPVRTFTMEELDRSKELVDSVNAVLAEGCRPYGGKFRSRSLKPGESLKVGLAGQGAVRALSIRLKADDQSQALRSTVLKASFDGETTIWSPAGDFFNIGVGMKTYRMWERSVEEDGTMTCRWVMPYRKNAQIVLENLGQQTVDAEIAVESGTYEWTSSSMHFHSAWRMDEPTPCFPLFDYNFVKVKGCGVYVGDQFTVLNPAQGWWGEGDEKVYVDDDRFPSHFGTGTEDYYGWAGGLVPGPEDEFDEPFLSNVRVASPKAMGYNTCTRTRVLDAIPFRDSIDFNIEASAGKRYSWFHLQYSASTYWYAKPGAVSNREPLPGMASRRTPALEDLQQFVEKCKSKVYAVEGAVEAENLATYRADDGVAPLEGMKIWGEFSNNAVKAFTFDREGQTLDVSLTELFDATALKMCIVYGSGSGDFDIMVNGKTVRTVQLDAEYSAMPVLDLGDAVPVNNAVKVTFLCRRPGNLGIDYFIVE